MKRFLPFLLIVALLACEDDSTITDDGTLSGNDSLTDSLQDSTLLDSLLDTTMADVVILSEQELDNALEDILDGGNVATPEGAMTFCDCIKKINEIEEAMFEAEVEDWPQYEEEMNALKNGPCAIINAGGGITTAEDKDAYQRMVDDCLK